jgi:hypothetical protein
MIGTLRFRRTVGYRPGSSQRITRTESRIPQRPDALPLPLDTNMHRQRMPVTSDAQFTVPGNRSRICCRCCWSTGALPNSAQEMPQKWVGPNSGACTARLPFPLLQFNLSPSEHARANSLLRRRIDEDVKRR